MASELCAETLDRASDLGESPARPFRDRVLQLSPVIDHVVEVSVGAEELAPVGVPVRLLSGE